MIWQRSFNRKGRAADKYLTIDMASHDALISSIKHVHGTVLLKKGMANQCHEMVQ